MAILIVAAVLAFLGAFNFFIEPLTRPLAVVAAPLHRLAVSWESAVGGRCGPANADQATLVDDLRIENAKLRTLVAENEALKSALDYRERATDRLVVSRVISETDNDVLHGLIIDRGSADGLQVGQPVIVGDGLLVGKIFSVRQQSATVMLLSDSRSRLAVTLQNGTDTMGVLEGDRGLAMRVNLIPQTEPVTPGNVVVTSGLEPQVRRGLVVGTVDKVESATQDPFQSAVVEPFDQAAHLTYVQVIVALADQ